MVDVEYLSDMELGAFEACVSQSSLRKVEPFKTKSSISSPN